MNFEPYFPPKMLTLISTYQCTAACPNCCFQCNPQRTERLTIEEMESIVEYCAKKFPSIELVVITGGEPFTLGSDLYAIIKKISSFGKMSRIVSNAYWASSYSKAVDIIQKLQDCGLTEINYSTGDEHQKFVQYDNIINAIQAALDNNMAVAVNVESALNKDFKSDILYKDTKLSKYLKDKEKYPIFRINNGKWIEKQSTVNEKGNFSYTTSIDSTCTSILTNICISPDMQYLSCCGFFNIKNKYLNYGFVTANNLETIHKKQFDNILKLWLYLEGPLKIAQSINRYAKKELIKIENKHMCEVCNLILSNEQFIDMIKSNISKELPRLILKYDICRRIENNSKYLAYEKGK